MVNIARQGVGDIVVAYVYHKIEIHPAYGFIDNALCLAGTESRHSTVYNVSILFVSGECYIILVLNGTFPPPFDKVIIDLFSEFLAAHDRNQAQSANWNVF